MVIASIISLIYFGSTGALKNQIRPTDTDIELLEAYQSVADEGEAFAEFDYRLNKELAVASGNPIYLLILNGFAGLYSRLGGLYFENPKGRDISRKYYQRLMELAQKGEFDEAVFAVRKYGIESGRLWLELKEDVLKELSE